MPIRFPDRSRDRPLRIPDVWMESPILSVRTCHSTEQGRCASGGWISWARIAAACLIAFLVIGASSFSDGVRAQGAVTGAVRGSGADQRSQTPPPKGSGARSRPQAADSRQRRSAAAVDVNAASAAELEQIRGIGPALAQRIVAVRTREGRFRDDADLRRRVRGIGEANLRRMVAAGLSIPGPARVDAAAAAGRAGLELIVGNTPPKSDGRGAGRIDELGCCVRPAEAGSR